MPDTIELTFFGSIESNSRKAVRFLKDYTDFAACLETINTEEN